MSLAPANLVAARLALVRAGMREAGVDALAVTNLTNLRYLTRLAATAGACVMTADACHLLVDFRYVASAREAIAGLPIDLARVETTYEEALMAVVRASGARVVGIEASSMTGAYRGLTGPRA